jgi:asparaginyl-tRNA synthetase
LRDFDLFYPGGYGEAISGAEREYTFHKVASRMKSGGEDPSDYKWYLDMLKEGTTPSAGFGIGVERLTRYICGLDHIWEAVPFPKVPGVISP